MKQKIQNQTTVKKNITTKKEQNMWNQYKKDFE